MLNLYREDEESKKSFIETVKDFKKTIQGLVDDVKYNVSFLNATLNLSKEIDKLTKKVDANQFTPKDEKKVQKIFKIAEELDWGDPQFSGFETSDVEKLVKLTEVSNLTEEKKKTEEWIEVFKKYDEYENAKENNKTKTSSTKESVEREM